MKKYIFLLALFFTFFGYAQQTIPSNSRLKITKNVKDKAAPKIVVQSTTDELNWIEKDSLKSQIGLDQVNNTSDANKPISTATQTALNTKQNTLTNPVTGTGTNNYLPIFTSAGAIGNSYMYQNGGVLKTSTGLYIKGGMAVDTKFSYCDLIGNDAFGTLTSGSYSAAFGTNSGRYSSTNAAVTDTYYSTFLGYYSRPLSTSTSHELVVGSGATGLGNYTSVFGSVNTNYGRWFGALLLGTNNWGGWSLTLDGTNSNTGNKGLIIQNTAYQINFANISNSIDYESSAGEGDLFTYKGNIYLKKVYSDYTTGGHGTALKRNLTGLGLDFGSDGYNGVWGTALNFDTIGLNYGLTSLIHTGNHYGNLLSAAGYTNVHPDMRQGALYTIETTGGYVQHYHDLDGQIYARGKWSGWKKYVYQDAPSLNILGSITGTTFVKTGGTSNQFLKANGDIDSTAYASLASPTFTGTPTAPTASVGTNNDQVATTAFVQANRPYKVWTGLITQSGTSDPTVVVLENTLGGSVIWTRNTTGQYFATSTGAFVVNKTSVLVNGGSSAVPAIGASRLSDNVVGVSTKNTFDGSFCDSIITEGTVEIRVYQ